jgi:hypothetical protein
MTESEFKYMKESSSADLVEMLTQDFGMSMQEALDVFYNSETYAKLNNPATGLYFQSSKYVYSYLKNELSTGVFS